MNSDDALQGIFIASFTAIGIATLVYTIWKKCKNNSGMKQSPSMEDLTSISSDDPQS